jgi:hypothetical protein
MPSANSYWGGFSTRRSPWSSNEERLVDEALMIASVPGELIRGIAPPLPQIDLWRPREGYGDAASRVPTIKDVLGSDRYYPDRRNDFSGSAGQYTGSSRPANGDGVPSGVNPY